MTEVEYRLPTHVIASHRIETMVTSKRALYVPCHQEIDNMLFLYINYVEFKPAALISGGADFFQNKREYYRRISINSTG
jgi:hypothetical protein